MIPSPALNAALFTHVFEVTPSELQGRVMATFMLVAGCASAVAPVIAGIAVAHSDSYWLTPLTVAVSGTGVILLASSRSVRKLGRE